MAKDKEKQALYRAEKLKRIKSRKIDRKHKCEQHKREQERIYGPEGSKQCYMCGGKMTWCSCCDMYSSYCCEEYGTCQCS